MLPVYRSDTNLQACIDGWVLAGVSYFCQGSTVGTTGQGGAGAPLPKCEISAHCSATADVYDPARRRVIARGVTWESELRALLPNDPVVATWSQAEIENVELCLEETGMENDVPIFTMHARTGCEPGETSAGEARSRGVAGHRLTGERLTTQSPTATSLPTRFRDSRKPRPAGGHTTPFA